MSLSKYMVVGLSTLLLAGCGAAVYHREYVHFGTLAQEHVKVLKELPCEWVGEPGVNDRSDAYDFACKGDPYGTVTLTMKAGRDGVLKDVRLFWREYEEGTYFYRDETTIKQFLRFISRHYGPGVHEKLTHTFFNIPSGQNLSPNERFVTMNMQFSYTRKKREEGYTLHRLKVTQKRDGVQTYETTYNKER